MLLLVTMALPKADFSSTGDGSEGHIYGRACIEVIDWGTRRSVKSIEYVPPPENLAEGLSVRFAGGCSYQGKWYQTSGTELIIYDTTEWSVERVISHPSFHDLHGVAVVDDVIAIANTGLDMVQFLDASGEIVREVNVASVPTWERFDRNTDYRRVVSTKPHEIHPNHVFQIDGQWWVTRCLKQDAVNLEDPADRIEIPVGQPHDGLIRGDFIYFTTTNGHVVIANIASRKVEDVVDLSQLNPAGPTIGWCRGLEVDGDAAYVGFTRIRSSKWSDTFRVVADALRGNRNTHIDRIDLKRKILVDTMDFDRRGSGAIFTLMDYRRATGTAEASPGGSQGRGA